jgi:hypothetical protein
MAEFDELAAHLARVSRLGLDEAEHVLGEVLAVLAQETVEQFVVRRHRELKAAGEARNETIYRIIAAELTSRPFAAPPLSERQIRRLIYG